MRDYTTDNRDKPSMKKCENCGAYGQPNHYCKFWSYDAYTEWSCSSPTAIKNKNKRKNKGKA